jgi:membrane-anchored protein YejM (alkaline phosphatase superfamily)
VRVGVVVAVVLVVVTSVRGDPYMIRQRSSFRHMTGFSYTNITTPNITYTQPQPQPQPQSQPHLKSLDYVRGGLKRRVV